MGDRPSDLGLDIRFIAEGNAVHLDLCIFIIYEVQY